MGYEFQVISLLFFAATIIYIYWGAYTMWLDSQASTNRLFLLVCISLGIWSFSFGMANSAGNIETALFWHRFSSFGWTTSYGFILHFVILLSTANPTVKQRIMLGLLHIPAIISLYVFGISNKMSPLQYNLEKINYGWINKLTNNQWDSLFNMYYMSYVVLAIVIVWLWQDKLEDNTVARRGKFIGATIIVSSVVGTFTDRFASSILENPIPQMAPLFIIIPTWAMYRSARYYGVMRKERTHTTDIIVSAADKKNIFEKLSLALYVAAILAFMFEYMPYRNEGASLKIALLKTLTFLGLGILIRLIQNIKEESQRENLTTVVVVSSIPIVLLQYLEYGNVTVWAYPMVIIISSIIFSKRAMLISTAVVSIGTQILIWILRPEVTVVISRYDYILRLGMLMVAFLAGLFINKMYVDKIKENEFQMEFQAMNAKISSDFITLNRENIDEKINKMLSEIGLFFNADRISMYSINNEDGAITYTHEWCKAGINREIENFETISIENFPWWLKQLEENKVVSIGDTRKIFKQAVNEQDQLNKLNIKSVISVPIEGKVGFSVFLMISSVTTYRAWPKHDVQLLHILANLLSEAFLKNESEKEVEYLAYYDSLTTLPNRLLFKDRVNKAINLAKQTNSSFSIMYLDLDNFQSVNGLIGYEGGDKLLRKVGQRLKKTVGNWGDVASFSGDEFMIRVKKAKSAKDILKMAEHVMASFAEPFNVQGQEFLITCSIGISSYPSDGEDADVLIESAEIAMNYAEDKGRNQYALCTPQMKAEVENNLSLLNDLYGALERGELVVYYQPQIDIKTGEVNGLEALVRWMHPTRGMISPGVFIPLAEENGLINSIGKWVLRTACIQNKQLQDMNLAPLRMGVNLSPIQLIDVNLVNFVADVLKETGLDAKHLELEITESVTIEEIGYIEQTLNQLKNMGIVIAIDDFGTEYSSFSRLKTLPIDRIKIDMQFIQGIEKNKKDRTITMTMINLAKGLGVNVIAEGVETEEQLDFLIEKQCDDVQGYYYYKPMPAEEIEELLRSI